MSWSVWAAIQNTINWWLISNLFLIVLEADKSKIKVLVVLVSGEDLLPGSQRVALSLCPRLVEGARESL